MSVRSVPENQGVLGFSPDGEGPKAEDGVCVPNDEVDGVDENGHICVKQGTFLGPATKGNGKTDLKSVHTPTSDVL
jgi:hypothetical protein